MKTIITLDKANQPFGFLQPDGSGNVYASGSFTGSFVGDGSGLINLPTQTVDTGSLVTTSSFQTYTASVDTFISSTTSQFAGTASYTQTASYAEYAVSASYEINYETSSSYAETASYAVQAISASYAPDTTFPYTGSAQITGSLGVTGSLNIKLSSTALYASESVAANTFHLRSSANLGLNAGPSAGISFVVNNTSPAMYITSGSQVLIGNPRVEPVSGSATLHVTNVGTSNSFLVEDSSYPDSSPFVINNVGDVGIGTTTPTSASLHVVGNVFANSFTGSLKGTASWAINATTASYIENAQTASYVLQAVSSSFASTASYTTTSANASDILIYVKNVTGAPIVKGKVVRISGATGDNALISTASWDSDGVSANTLGITNETIADQSFGYVITEGKLIGIDTDSFVAGELLFLGPTGSIIDYEPIPPKHTVRLGQALRIQQNNGSMYVRIDNGYELDELHNVLIISGSDGDLLVASGSNDNGKKLYINSRQLTGSYAITGSLTITDGTNVTTIGATTLDDYLYDKFMTNQYAYFLPSDGTTTYSGLRTAGGTILSTGTVSTLSENPMGILFTTPAAVGSVAAQYGTVFGGSIQSTNFQFEMIRKFRVNTNNGNQRLFVGLSSLYNTTAPTNVDPLTLINSVGVAKLQASSNLHFIWNDGSGTASSLDLGASFSAVSTAVTYKLKVSKTYGVAALNLQLTQITNATGATLVASTTITSDYSSGSAQYPVAWMGNNPGVSGAVSFKDYGCQLFKRNIISF